ncbi:MAG: SdrD B-like domain-containing protein [Chloroflexota bacterium]
MSKKFPIFMFCLACVLNACTPKANLPAQPPEQNISIEATLTPTTEPKIVFTPTPQPNGGLVSVGPNREDFPEGYNPLTGQPMVDPSLAHIPALLVSISHFPATARPQAGVSFAPYVFEFSITEGQTRYLAAFYGEFPAPEVPVTGDCAVRTGVFEQTELLIGNQVWLDTNGDGQQNINERGVPGVCVRLLDMQGNQVQSGTTDTNGYYGFNVEAGHYIVDVEKPGWSNFTEPNLGD